MKIKLFTQSNCPKCPAAKSIVKKVAEETSTELVEIDINSVDGLAEASFHMVQSTPSTVVVDDDDNELFAVRGEAPSEKDLKEALKA